MKEEEILQAFNEVSETANFWISEAERLCEDLEVAKKALDFYADKQNWNWNRWPGCPTDHDLGKKATEAITKIYES